MKKSYAYILTMALAFIVAFISDGIAPAWATDSIIDQQAVVNNATETVYFT